MNNKMTRINLMLCRDENGYPADIFLWDTSNLIASYERPLRVTIIELESLFNDLGPLISSYKKWQKEHESYQYGETEEKPKTVVALKDGEYRTHY